VQLPTAADVEEVRTRIERAGIAVERDDQGITVRDPWQIAVRVEEASR
jgi:hypothetical protein